jgi:HPt (histidine-containing phosphotransfer) domain-containing protein
LEIERMEEGPITIAVDEEIIDLIPRYLENRQGDVAAIEAALGNADFDTIRRLGHSMKGSGGGYGLNPVTEMGRGLEDAARAEDPAAAREWLEKLQDFLQRVRVVPG